ncbi:MAG: hypothetical protein ACKVPY_14810 [Paracoccaceae bacterium]
MRAGAALAAAILLVALPPASARVGTVGLDWFTGHYSRTGEDGADPPGNLDDVIRIDYRGEWIELAACDGRFGRLTYDPSFDYSDHLVGQIAGQAADCRYENNASRPRLHCETAAGGRFTLTALAEGGPGLACDP